NCLIKAGADFKEHTLYKTHYETSFFTPTAADAVLFTSASSVRGFKQACPDTYPKHTCCIGRQTAEEAAKLGYPNIKTAKKATIEELVNTLEEI
ncbi:MAG: uroporphyrinogen-III synthase, partial [Synergistaceae bacterium]